MLADSAAAAAGLATPTCDIVPRGLRLNFVSQGQFTRSFVKFFAVVNIWNTLSVSTLYFKSLYSFKKTINNIHLIIIIIIIIIIVKVLPSYPFPPTQSRLVAAYL